MNSETYSQKPATGVGSGDLLADLQREATEAWNKYYQLYHRNVPIIDVLSAYEVWRLAQSKLESSAQSANTEVSSGAKNP